jgi:uncharacterized protein (TIGR01777 family)
MKILISGSSGFIGTALTNHLRKNENEVIRLLRNSTSLKNEIKWNIDNKDYNIGDFEGIDSFINLSGENVFGIWTKEKKRKIIDSRINSTQLLYEIISKLKKPPKTFISASAIGYYGNRGDELLDEDSDKGSGFFPDLAEQWENISKQAEKLNIRVVNIRIGLVLSKDGGALSKMLTPFKLGLGGKIADGKMYWSWIALDDILASIEFILRNDNIKGAVNLVSTNPLKNNEFTHILGNVINRPTFLPVPKLFIEYLLGDMGREVLLASTRVVPKKLLDNGYKFKYTELKKTLKYLLR